HRAACGDQPPRRRCARAHPDGRRRDRRAIRCACRAAHPRRVAAAFSRAARSFGRPAFRVRTRADAGGPLLDPAHAERAMRRPFALMVALASVLAGPAAAERLIASLTNHRVMITSSYS